MYVFGLSARLFKYVLVIFRTAWAISSFSCHEKFRVAIYMRWKNTGMDADSEGWDITDIGSGRMKGHALRMGEDDSTYEATIDFKKVQE